MAIGAGSGAGAEVTALGERLQAYTCAARQYFGKDLTDISQVTDKTSKDADCDRKLTDCLLQLDEDWFHSSIVTANLIFKDIKKIFRESFFTVLLLTIIFNGLYFLVLKSIATKFTFLIIFALMGLIISTIAYKVHRDILLNQTVFSPLLKMFDFINKIL